MTEDLMMGNEVEQENKEAQGSDIGQMQKKSWYAEEMFYERSDNGRLVEGHQQYIDVMLEKNVPVGFISGFFTDDFQIYTVSGFALSNLGYNYEKYREYTDGSLLKLIYPEDRRIVTEDLQAKAASQRKIRMLHRNGEPVWFQAIQVPIDTVDGDKMWMVSLRMIDDNMIGSFCERDYSMIGLIDCAEKSFTIEKGIRYHGLKRMVRGRNYDYEELTDNDLQKNVRPEDLDECKQNISIDNICEKLRENELYEIVMYRKTEDDTYAAMRYKFRYFDREREIILCTEEDVRVWAEIDDKTSSLNEQGFFHQVAKVLKANEDKVYYILYFDIKGFKAWNELLGQKGGDQALRAVADSLKTSKMKPVCVARIIADQFACLVEEENLDYENVAFLCNRKIVAGGNVLKLRMHCGIYKVEGYVMNIRGMCDKAKLAATYVNNEIASPYCIFDAGMNERYINTIGILDSLENALYNEEFHTYYQPVYDAETKNIVAAEALVRWITEDGGVISPGLFIPALEEKGHIAELDLFMQRHVQEFLEERHHKGQKIVPISLNLSRMDFINEDAIKRLFLSIDGSKIGCRFMNFEVTESAYMDIGSSGGETLDNLRKRGAKILIDDFGTGYSSLGNLADQTFDVIKLDMSFVRRIGKSDKSNEIIKMIIELTHKMDAKVLAEGVEDEYQYEFLKENGCDYVQGYYFSKPLDEEAFQRLLDAEDGSVEASEALVAAGGYDNEIYEEVCDIEENTGEEISEDLAGAEERETQRVSNEDLLDDEARAEIAKDLGNLLG